MEDTFEDIYYQGQHIINLDDIKIVGRHNIQNMMIAICACIHSGIDVQSIHDTLAAFMIASFIYLTISVFGHFISLANRSPASPKQIR